MEPHLLHPTNLRLSTSTSLTSVTHSITLCGEHAYKRNPTIHCLQLSKRSSDPSLKTKKELSRLLRTDAAVRNIERKANSNKYNNLWPKAILEALDEAIANDLWESALKVVDELLKRREETEWFIEGDFDAYVVDELLKRWEETEWFIEGDFDAYVKRLQQPYVWGGEPELLMASHVLKLQAEFPANTNILYVDLP